MLLGEIIDETLEIFVFLIEEAVFVGHAAFNHVLNVGNGGEDALEADGWNQIIVFVAGEVFDTAAVDAQTGTD